MRTNFWDLNMASELTCFFVALPGATEYHWFKFPLGHSNGVTYSFSPIGTTLQLEEKVMDQQKLAELASPAYFYVQKRDIGQVSHLPWGGSLASLSPGYVQNAERKRKLSIRSSNSEDSGYASGNAHSVSENLAAISEDEPEEQARLGSLNGLKRSTSDLVISFPFFTFGRLYSKLTSSKSRATITDYIVAVSLCDFRCGQYLMHGMRTGWRQWKEMKLTGLGWTATRRPSSHYVRVHGERCPESTVEFRW